MPKGEILTQEACRRILTDGKILYIPRVGLDFEKPDMVMTRVLPTNGNENNVKKNVCEHNLKDN